MADILPCSGARGLPSQPANNVHFGPGVHSVGGGLLLGEADSGVVVSGEGPGITVLTGGTALPPWTVARDATTGRPLWSAPLAAASHPRRLGRAAHAARRAGGRGRGRGRAVPLRASVHGSLRRDVVQPRLCSGPEAHSIVYRAGQVQGTGYYNQGDVLVTLFHCWTATTHRIASIAPSNSTLTVASPPEPHVETFLTASMQAGSGS